MYKVNKISTKFRHYHSITDVVENFVKESDVVTGILTVTSLRPTTGFAITSFWDQRGLDDLVDEIDRNFPTRVNYKKQHSPYDSSGHIKSSIIKNSLNLIINDGKVVLGSSQGLVLLDFDGPQECEYVMSIKEFDDLKLETIGVETSFMSMNNVTQKLKELIKTNNVENGLLHVSVLHSTAGLVISSNQSESHVKDFNDQIELMVPTRVDFKHRETAADAGGHVKTALSGTQLTLLVENGKLLLGDKQAVYFAEFDGPRPRKLSVAVIKN